jgi:hypothetical protein
LFEAARLALRDRFEGPQRYLDERAHTPASASEPRLPRSHVQGPNRVRRDTQKMHLRSLVAGRGLRLCRVGHARFLGGHCALPDDMLVATSAASAAPDASVRQRMSNDRHKKLGCRASAVYSFFFAGFKRCVRLGNAW